MASPPAGPAAPARAWLHTATAVAEALFSTTAGPPPAPRLHWLASELADFLSRSAPKARWLFRASLLAVALLAPVLAGRPWPFRWLPIQRRIRGLERLERSAVGAPLFAVKAILCILYYEHPDAAREIGFDGACREPAS